MIQTSAVRNKPRRTLFVFSQHQISAALATAVDYVFMVLCVSVLGRSATFGTVVGSFFGALTSFTLGRRWVFQSASGNVRGQAARYALISALSLFFNAEGEKWLVKAGVNYFIARVILSVIVGMVWNFPMHRYFVFRAAPLPALDDEDAAVSGDARPQTAPHRTS